MGEGKEGGKMAKEKAGRVGKRGEKVKKVKAWRNHIWKELKCKRKDILDKGE